MAHKKGQGSSRNGRDSNAQRRGVKKFGGEKVIAGNILVSSPDETIAYSQEVVERTQIIRELRC